MGEFGSTARRGGGAYQRQMVTAGIPLGGERRATGRGRRLLWDLAGPCCGPQFPRVEEPWAPDVFATLALTARCS